MTGGLIVVTLATLGISAVCSLFEAALDRSQLGDPQARTAERATHLDGVDPSCHA